MPKQKTICRRLFVALLLLFIMQVLLLPAVISATYATKSVKPEHIITYTPGKLSWDKTPKPILRARQGFSFSIRLMKTLRRITEKKRLLPERSAKA